MNADLNCRVTELWLYPIKGCAGVRLHSATLADTGLEHEGIGDREWVLADAAGEFLSQRSHPLMALVQPRLTASSLRLKAPGMIDLDLPFDSEGDVVRVQVWNDELAGVTQGELADAWFSRYLGTPCRLLRFDPEQRRLAAARDTGAVAAPYKFADAFPLLVLGEGSMDDLNARLAALGAAPVDQRRFRPNVVLGDMPAHEEDFLATLEHGALLLDCVKPCARCTVPGVDPDTAASDTTVTDLLASYRRTAEGVMFGVNAIVARGAGAQLSEGDMLVGRLRFG